MQIVRGHQHVAVSHDYPGVLGRVPALYHVVELGIVANAIVSDQQPRADLRIAVNKPAHQGNHRIARACDAKDDFVARVLQLECRAQRLFRKVLDSTDRPHDRDPDIHGMPLRRAIAADAPQDDNDAGELEKRRDNAKPQGCIDQNRHSR